jgi:thiol-disulfide isomerase/thioredoxin
MKLVSLKEKIAAFGFAILAIACSTFASASEDSDAKTKSPSGPSVEQKPKSVVVLIHSRVCPVCAKVRPIIQELAAVYEPGVCFVYLDVTDDKAKAKSKQLAKSLRLAAFFNMYADTFPCVGFFDKNEHPIHELCGAYPKRKYEEYIKKGLEKS